MKEYWCVCGKKFDNPQKFNAHKSHCRIHLGEDKYLQTIIHMKKMSHIANSKKHYDTLIKKDRELKRWISEQHRCEHCGKIMLKKFGSGRFCSSSCANSRKRTVEEIEKIKTTLMHTLLNKKQEEKVLDTTKNNIRGFYDDVYMASGYELIFYLYCKENNIIITRYPYRFCYEYNGMKKVYIPDFYLPESDKIIELKGRGKYYNEELVAAKTQCVKEHNYKIIYDDEIESYYKWCSIHFNIPRVKVNTFLRQLLNIKTNNAGSKNTDIINKKHLPKTKGYVWIHRENKNTLIPESLLDDYLNKGWEKGRIKFK